MGDRRIDDAPADGAVEPPDIVDQIASAARDAAQRQKERDRQTALRLSSKWKE